MTVDPRPWRILSAIALVLASLSMALSAFLFTNLRGVSVQGCQRQNELRKELNSTLRRFHQSPRFELIDCTKAYSVRFF